MLSHLWHSKAGFREPAQGQPDRRARSAAGGTGQAAALIVLARFTDLEPGQTAPTSAKRLLFGSSVKTH